MNLLQPNLHKVALSEGCKIVQMQNIQIPRHFILYIYIIICPCIIKLIAMEIKQNQFIYQTILQFIVDNLEVRVIITMNLFVNRNPFLPLS